MRTKIRCYLSHPIRAGEDDPSFDTMYKNCQIAINFANYLRGKIKEWQKYNATFPNVEIYCPAEHDEFVVIAWQKGYLNENQILEVDCKIIESCDCLIYYRGNLGSNGMLKEIHKAKEIGLPCMYFVDGNEDNKVLLGLTEDMFKEAAIRKEIYEATSK